MTLEQNLEVKKILMNLVGRIDELPADVEDALFIFTGEGPYKSEDLCKRLRDEQSYNLNSEEPPDWPFLDAGENPAYMIIGKENYDEEEIVNFALKFGSNSVFLPQEGYLDLILFGHNWWTEKPESLNEGLDHHRGLKYAKSLSATQAYDFKWPSTFVSPSFQLPESINTSVEYDEDSCLSRNGYKHWPNGRELPDHELVAALHKAIDAEGLEEVVYTMAGFLKRYRRQQKNHNAQEKYVRHLAYMKKEYYEKGFYGFTWPE